MRKLSLIDWRTILHQLINLGLPFERRKTEAYTCVTSTLKDTSTRRNHLAASEELECHLYMEANVCLQFPSVYSKTRRRALEHTLDRFHNDHYPNAPYFLFGDFNFRTDTSGVIKVGRSPFAIATS